MQFYNAPVKIEYIRQIPGMKSIVIAVYDVPVGEVWPEERVAELWVRHISMVYGKQQKYKKYRKKYLVILMDIKYF